MASKVWKVVVPLGALVNTNVSITVNVTIITNVNMNANISQNHLIGAGSGSLLLFFSQNVTEKEVKKLLGPQGKQATLTEVPWKGDVENTMTVDIPIKDEHLLWSLESALAGEEVDVNQIPDKYRWIFEKNEQEEEEEEETTAKEKGKAKGEDKDVGQLVENLESLGFSSLDEIEALCQKYEGKTDKEFEEELMQLLPHWKKVYVRCDDNVDGIKGTLYAVFDEKTKQVHYFSHHKDFVRRKAWSYFCWNSPPWNLGKRTMRPVIEKFGSKYIAYVKEHPWRKKIQPTEYQQHFEDEGGVPENCRLISVYYPQGNQLTDFKYSVLLEQS